MASLVTTERVIIQFSLLPHESHEFLRARGRAVALTLQATLSAHDIPDEIVVQSYVRPQQNQLQVLLRVPLLAIADANLPKDGTGYLAMPYLDPALREAANQISNGIVFLEGDERLIRYDMANARISLPSDRSFDTLRGRARARAGREAARRDAGLLQPGLSGSRAELSDSVPGFAVLDARAVRARPGATGRRPTSISSVRTAPSARSGFTTTRRWFVSIRKRIRRPGCS